MIRPGPMRRQFTVVPPTINVTPLVDIVLVLLIIFMIVVPQLDSDLPVDLPSIFNPDPEVQSGLPLKVTITKDGAYQYEGQMYDLDSLIATLEAARAENPTRRLIVRADAALSYGVLRTVQSRLQTAGFPGMSYVVNQRHRSDGGGPHAEEGADSTGARRG
jgi:biopolymer transport protein TolR